MSFGDSAALGGESRPRGRTRGYRKHSIRASDARDVSSSQGSRADTTNRRENDVKKGRRNVKVRQGGFSAGKKPGVKGENRTMRASRCALAGLTRRWSAGTGRSGRRQRHAGPRPPKSGRFARRRGGANWALSGDSSRPTDCLTDRRTRALRFVSAAPFVYGRKHLFTKVDYDLFRGRAGRNNGWRFRGFNEPANHKTKTGENQMKIFFGQDHRGPAAALRVRIDRRERRKGASDAPAFFVDQQWYSALAGNLRAVSPAADNQPDPPGPGGWKRAPKQPGAPTIFQPRRPPARLAVKIAARSHRQRGPWQNAQGVS